MQRGYLQYILQTVAWGDTEIRSEQGQNTRETQLVTEPLRIFLSTKKKLEGHNVPKIYRTCINISDTSHHPLLSDFLLYFT